MFRLAEGDTEAFVELVERWQPRLAQLLLFKGAARDELDDLLQEVFLRVYNYRDRFRLDTSSSVRSFLCCVAQRTYIDAWRRRAGRRRTGVCFVSLDAASDVSCPDPLHREEAIDLEVAVRGLSPKLRDVVVLAVWQGLSYVEVAEVLGVPVGTVKSRMHLAIRRLSEALDVEARL